MQPHLEHLNERIPLLSIHAGPNSPEWPNRLKEQLRALITLVKSNKQSDNDWFNIKPDPTGLNWNGTCSYTHNYYRFTFNIRFTVPPTYPSSPIEIQLPQLEGKTIKMYRGGKICQDVHFAPLWAKQTPKLGIAHAMVMALGPWLAAEVPDMVREGRLVPE